MARYNIFALEGAEDEFDSVITSDELCNGIISAQTTSQIFEQGDDETKENAENAQVLFQMQEALSNEESPSISAASAEVVAIAVEHLCKRSKLKKRQVFALEAFDSKVTRKEALKIAVEGIGDHIKAMVAKILEWIKNAAQWIYASLKSLTEGAEALIKRSRKIQEATKGLASMAVKPGVNGLSDSTLVSFFSAEGKFLDPDAIGAKYTLDTKNLGVSFKDKFLLGTNNSIKKIVSDSSNGGKEDAIKAEVDTVLKALQTGSLTEFKDASSSDKNFKVIRYPCAFGQKEITVTFSLNTTDNTKYTGVKVSAAESATNKPAEKGALLKVLSGSQIDAIAKSVEEQMLHGLYKDNTKTISEISAIEKLVEGGCNDITRRQHSQENISDKELTFSVNFLREMASSVLGMSKIIHEITVVSSKHMLDYCEQSIKQYVKA